MTRDQHATAQEPTIGVVTGDCFLLLANGFVARMRTIEDAASVAEPVVLSMPLAR